ncbi:MAG TPA: AAA family ATPase [Dermatophilaceae bacterium]|nr:AAA family ATPase [Dermatophilaceae bacterium]
MGAVPDAAGSRLIGRLNETKALVGVLAQAALGHPGAMVIHGEAGVGKTRLVKEVCAGVLGEGYEVLWGSCVHFGAASLSYAPMVSALDRWASQADRMVAAEVFADAEELTALLPSIGVRASAEVPGTVLSWIDTVLLRLARRAPTVLVVDDLQWADAASLDALAYLIAGFGVQRLAVIVTIRLEERPEGSPLHTWLADVRRLPGVSELTLERLDAQETAEQIASLLPSPASEEYMADVHRWSRGNAYLTELIVRNASAGLRRVPADPPQALREAVSARWHTLSRPAREVTRLLAVGGRPVSFERLAVVAKVALPSVSGLPALLREALDAGVLRLAGDRTYWFWHPLLAEVLLDALDPAEAAPMHAAYAGELEAVVNRSPFLAADLATHHEAAGQLDAAFRWSLAAADYAAHLRATAELSRHLTRACSLWDQVSPQVRGESDRLALLSRAANAAEAIGDYDTANDLLGTALELVDRGRDPLTASTLLVAWTRVDWGHSPGQYWYRPEMRTAIELTESSPDSPERALALARLAQAQCWDDDADPDDAVDSRGNRLPGLAAADDALATAQRSGSPLARAHALTAHAMVTRRDPASNSLAELEEAYTLASSADATWIAETAIWWVNRLTDDGRLADAAEVARRASADALSAGSSHYGYFLAAHGASLLIDLGRWEEARELLRPALAAGSAGVTGAFARCDAAWLAVRAGRVSEARRHLERIAEIVRPDFTGVPITAVTVEVMLAERQPDLALDYLDRRWPLHLKDLDIGGLDPLMTWGATIVADLAERARDRGDVAGIAAAVRALDALVSRRAALPGARFTNGSGKDHPRRVLEARFAAEALRCTGGPGQAVAWRQVRDRASMAGLVWDEAIASWRLGRALLAEGAAGAAAEALRASHAIARQLQAQPLCEDVESLARTAHISLDQVDAIPALTPSRGTPTPLAVLTDREREVLSLLVAGRSNGEIARDLFISPKTVSVHVSNILHKTGTTSRVEAAAWAKRMSEGADA